MERKSVSLEEQETSISLSPLDKFAEVYSCEPTVVKRLYKYAEEHPDVCRITMDDGYGVTCEMPKAWIKYKPVAKRNVRFSFLAGMNPTEARGLTSHSLFHDQ